MLMHEIDVLWAPIIDSCVAELDDTLPHLTGVQWDSVRITHGVSIEAYTWKTALGRGWTWPDSLTASRTVATHGALLARGCYVVRFYLLQGVLLIQISTTPLEMGDGLLAESKRSNWTSFMIHMAYEMDVVMIITYIKLLWLHLHA
jgi:hypothetical protein